MTYSDNSYFTGSMFGLFGICTAAWLVALGEGLNDEVRFAVDNHKEVVANMTADFRSFDVCGEQANMLAEQTADFGVLGMITTVAAIGIDTGKPVIGDLGRAVARVPNMIERRSTGAALRATHIQ